MKLVKDIFYKLYKRTISILYLFEIIIFKNIVHANIYKTKCHPLILKICCQKYENIIILLYNTRK